MVSLKLKLLSSPLYLLSSTYIFTRFISSLLKPQLCPDRSVIVSRLIQGWFYYINKVGCSNKINCTNRMGCANKVGYIISNTKIGVLIVVYKVGFLVVVVLVLILAKLFLRRQAIRPNLNSLPAAIQSLTSDSVYSVGSSSCKVLNKDCRTITHLSFLTHTLQT